MADCAAGRVLMTGDTVGGVWTFTLELARALEKRGMAVTLASLGGEPSDEQREEAGAVANLQLHTSSYKLEWMDDPWDDVEASGRWLLELEKQFRPDVIHLNSLGHGSLQFQAPVVMTAHSCVLSWWAAVKREALPVRWGRYRYEVETSLKAVDFVTAPSTAMLRSVEENYGPDLPPNRVVPNGRHPGRFRPGNKEPFVLAAGRLWDEGKNIAALAEVSRDIPWPIYVAGEERSPDGVSANLGACRGLGRLSPAVLAVSAWPGGNLCVPDYTNRSAYRHWKRQYRDARWFCAISKAYAKSGATPPCMCCRTTPTVFRRRSSCSSTINRCAWK